MPEDLALDTALCFERIALEKVWGGRALASSLGFDLPPDVPIGETWEVVDRAGENSTVRGGMLGGRTLRELMESSAPALLGAARPTADGRFPLLVKYIDASDDLSVQVHPDDATAAEIGGGAEGKTEAWFIVSAEPGACLYAGLREGVTAEVFAREASGPGVVDLLCRWEVRPGDCVLVPGGTVHAIGKGITLLEVQQNSDTTYRLYDWGRVGLDGEPRETHVEQALRCVAFGTPPRPPAPTGWREDGAGVGRAELCRCAHFTMDRLRAAGEVELDSGGAVRIYAVMDGAGALRTEGGGTLPLARGDTVLVPASAGAHALVPDGQALDVVLVSTGS